MGSTLNDLVDVVKLLVKSPGGLSRHEIVEKLALSFPYLEDICKEAKKFNLPIEETDHKISLTDKVDLLDEDLIYQNVIGRGRVTVLKSVDSTNAALLNHPDTAVSGDVLLTEIQTQGRGRRGNRWQSGFGEDLMISMLYHLKGQDLENTRGLSIICAIALINAFESLDIKGVQLKWPNDLYFDGAKLGGILVETNPAPLEDETAVVIGFGINVHGRGAKRSKKLKRPVATLEDTACFKLSRNKIAVAAINSLKEALLQFESTGFESFLARFKEVDAIFKRKISVQTGNKLVTGTALGIDNKGCLKVKTPEGSLFLASGFNLTVL